MADEDETRQREKKEKPEKQKATKSEADDKKSLVGRFLPKIVVAVVVVIFAGAGFTLGRLFAGSPTPQTPGASEQDQSTQVENLEAKGSADGSQESWYYHLDPVVANLDVTDVTRYVRASLTLEVSSEMDEKKARLFLDKK
jgi:flagellar basal body-associated protein FliL